MKKQILWILLGFILSSSVMARDLKLAVYPSNDPRKLIIPMRIMADYLSEKTGERFVAVVTRDYEELSERLKNRTVDIAWINPINYLKIKAENPDIKYVATYMEKNETTGKIIPYYQSYIITLKSSGIANLSDAKNKRFAFTDPGSTSGYAFPLLIMSKKKIKPADYFKKVFFLKKHDRVINALVRGSIDLGAVSDGTYFTAIRNHGDLFRVIVKSPPIPLDAIVATDNFSDARIEEFGEYLASMPENHLFNRSMLENLGWHAAGFSIKNDQFYDSMREALK